MEEEIKLLLDQIDDAVREYFLEKDESPQENEVRKIYTQYLNAYLSMPLYSRLELDCEDAVNKLVDKYCTERTITKRVGFAYADDSSHPWLNSAEDSIDWFYWRRYKRYLLKTKGWSDAVVRSIDRDTHAVLDLIANPMDTNPFERRGLVVASVQSGKTANYIGLITRAADAGYKVIIVMAGIHNVLRNQTQSRLEEGFTGYDIANRKVVGVGKKSDTRRPISCTSRIKDFNKEQADALFTLQTKHFNGPMLFVVKKNVSALRQVYEWLTHNANTSDQLLLIDDEADNASINVNYGLKNPDIDPSRINGQIRTILDFFERRCYVGYTATPFANILIDPTVEDEEFGKDLFPSSFVYNLEESSEYFGAAKVFGDYDEDAQSYLRLLDDIDSYLPPKHKSDFIPSSIPNSMKYAIRTFVLATTIRALRGDSDKHSTMMVNVSPFKIPQKYISYLIKDYLECLKQGLKAFCKLSSEKALLASPDLKQLHETWQREYSDLEFNWNVIQPALYDSMKTIRIVCINADSNDRLEYESHVDHVIAVGGYRLSRGLTLEGLVVSYYSRNAKAYDALMQMARWFGYRPRYEDLCRVWMSDTSAGWYKYVADATADLFDELRDMRQSNSSPQDYMLRIRQCPDSLIVTARNKRGAGELTKAPIDLNTGFVETIAFNRSFQIIEANTNAALQLFDNIHKKAEDTSLGYLYRKVPRDRIVEFIDSYKNEDIASPKSEKKPVLDYIAARKADGELEEWDVLLTHGDSASSEYENGSLNVPGIGVIPRERRYPGNKSSESVLWVGERHKLAGRGVERAGLSDEEISLAESDFQATHGDSQKNISDLYYRKYRSRPLLIIHPVLMRFSSKQITGAIKKGKIPTIAGWPSWEHCEPALGWSISFPKSAKQQRLVEYVFNSAAIKSMLEDDFEDTNEIEGDEYE